MRRNARANPLVRRQINSLLREVKVSSSDGWPTHLAIAHKILRDELAVSDEVARSIITASVSAAYLCARAIDQRVGNIVEFQTCNKLHQAFKRIANCVKRGPANLRKRLDAEVVPLIQGEHVDLEVIESVFDTTVKVFTEYSHHEAATMALAVMMYQPCGGERYMTVKNDFPALSVGDRIKSEKALAALGKASNKLQTASGIFTVLSNALQNKRYAKADSQIHTLIVDYVDVVADVWRRAGLKPSRAGHVEEPTYKSKFHRFVDLVLTEMIEPWARRHDGTAEDFGRRVRLARENLPREYRSIASPALRRPDVEWLVSADHIDKALADSKNRQ